MYIISYIGHNAAEISQWFVKISAKIVQMLFVLVLLLLRIDYIGVTYVFDEAAAFTCLVANMID